MPKQFENRGSSEFVPDENLNLIHIKISALA